MELAALNVEADMPIEDLLAMYKGAGGGDDLDLSDAESDPMDLMDGMNGKVCFLPSFVRDPMKAVIQNWCRIGVSIWSSCISQFATFDMKHLYRCLHVNPVNVSLQLDANATNN